jgi:hypothetical protein
LTLAFYPLSYRQEKEKSQTRDDRSTTSSTEGKEDGGDMGDARDPDQRVRSRLVVVLNRLEHLPSVMSFIKLVQPTPSWQLRGGAEVEPTKAEKNVEPARPDRPNTLLSVDALRLVELTERTSAVMKASDGEATARSDLLANIFKTFASLNMIPVRNRMSIVSPDELSPSVASFATECGADLVVLPWNTGPSTRIEEEPGPFDHIFGRGSFGSAERYPQYAGFVRDVFAQTPADVAVYLDQGSYSASFAAGARKHIFLAFGGEADDRLALELVVQFCRNPGVSATVVRIIRDPQAKDHLQGGTSLLTNETSNAETLAETPVIGSVSDTPVDTIYQVRMASIVVLDMSQQAFLMDSSPWQQSPMGQLMADDQSLSYYFGSAVEAASSEPVRPAVDIRQPEATRDALSRVRFATVSTSTPLRSILSRADTFSKDERAPLLLVAGRSRRGAESDQAELADLLKERAAATGDVGIASSPEVRKSLGAVASSLVVAGIKASLLVVQSGQAGVVRNTNAVKPNV